MRGEDNLQRAGADLDPIARYERPAAAPFGGAVDPNSAGLNQGLGLATRLDHLCPLEKSPELNARRADGQVFCGHVLPSGSQPYQL